MKKKIDALAYSAEIAQALKKAAFVTTKCGDKVNTMAIGWGISGVSGSARCSSLM